MRLAGFMASAVFLLVASFGDVRAGDFHRSADIVCSDCHTQHYTQVGNPAGWQPGGPFTGLLVASSTNVLCLFCHDGSDPDAPDVLAPVNLYEGSGDETSAGGFFSGAPGTPSPMSHDLDVPAPVPLRSDGRVMSLTCASCHAVHGNEFYRNLLANPDSLGGSSGMRVDHDIFLGSRPAVPPSRAATIQAYRASNTGYAAGMRDWCARCHDQLASDAPGGPPAHFLRHPGEATMGTRGAHVDLTHWIQGRGGGFGERTGDGTEGIPRVRFQVPGAASYAQARQAGVTSEVFCGSCHLAHGGSYTRALVWPYREGGADDRSACNQCHNP